MDCVLLLKDFSEFSVDPKWSISMVYDNITVLNLKNNSLTCITLSYKWHTTKQQLEKTKLLHAFNPILRIIECSQLNNGIAD